VLIIAGIRLVVPFFTVKCSEFESYEKDDILSTCEVCKINVYAAMQFS
jgi:hypothetical protein